MNKLNFLFEKIPVKVLLSIENNRNMAKILKGRTYCSGVNLIKIFESNGLVKTEKKKGSRERIINFTEKGEKIKGLILNIKEVKL